MKMQSWPVCPKCVKRRVAFCRFCKTTGDDFPLADLDYENHLEEDEEAEEGGSCCNSLQHHSVIPSALSPKSPELVSVPGISEAENEPQEGVKLHGPMLALTNPLDSPEDFAPDREDVYPLSVVCPACDEMIRPRFLKICQCGHVYEDGILQDGVSVHVQTCENSPESNQRVIIAFLGLILVCALLVFALLLI